VKLVLTVFATAALFVHQTTAITEAARLAADATAPLLQEGRLRELGMRLADSSIAALLLVGMTLIAVYKPWEVVGYFGRSLKLSSRR
jgi:hypothetical protein